MDTNDTINAEIQELSSDLLREDEMGAVVRAHIRLESLLIQKIRELLPYPTHLKRMKLDYDGRVSLALALGLDQKFGPPFRALGKLRNDFAHKLDMTLTEDTVANLYDSLAPEDKDRAQACFRMIKTVDEDARDTPRFADLEPGDQFTLIAITLWAAMRSTVNAPPRSVEDHA